MNVSGKEFTKNIYQGSAPLCQLDSLFLTSHLILEEDLCLCEQMDSSRSTHLAVAVEIELPFAILPTKFQI